MRGNDWITEDPSGISTLQSDTLSSLLPRLKTVPMAAKTKLAFSSLPGLFGFISAHRSHTRTFLLGAACAARAGKSGRRLFRGPNSLHLPSKCCSLTAWSGSQLHAAVRYHAPTLFPAIICAIISSHS